MHIAKYFPSLVKRGDHVFVFDGVKEPEAYGAQPPPFNTKDPNATTTTTAPPTTTRAAQAGHDAAAHAGAHGPADHPGSGHHAGSGHHRRSGDASRDLVDPGGIVPGTGS